MTRTEYQQMSTGYSLNYLAEDMGSFTPYLVFYVNGQVIGRVERTAENDVEALDTMRLSLIAEDALGNRHLEIVKVYR